MFKDSHRATNIIRDSERIPRNLIHEEYFVSSARTAHGAAKEYLAKFHQLMEIKAGELKNLDLSPERDLTEAGVEYRLVGDKPQFDTTTVSYQQTVFGLPVWDAGLAVYMKHAKEGRFRIFGAQVTRHPETKPSKASARALVRLKHLDAP